MTSIPGEVLFSLWEWYFAVLCVAAGVAGVNAVQSVRIAAQRESLASGGSDGNEATCSVKDPATEETLRAADDQFATRTANRLGAANVSFRFLGTTGLLTFAAILGIENYGIDPILRRTFQTVQSREGVRISFESATGGILHGNLTLKKLRIERDNLPKANFHLQCDLARVSCNPLTWFRDSNRIDRLSLVGVTGDLELPQPNRFEIEHLLVEDSKLQVTQHLPEGEPLTFEWQVDSLNCQRFRTDKAPFDIVFRSQFDGQINRSPVQVTTKSVPEGELTEWQVSAIPVSFLGTFFGGPFRWISAGDVDFHAVQLVRSDAHLPVLLDCEIAVVNVQAGVPEGLRPAAAVGAQLLVDQLNQRSRPLLLSFHVELDRNQFDLRSVESLSQFSQQIRLAAVTALMRETGVKLDLVADLLGAENSDEVIERLSDLAARVRERAQERRRVRREVRGKR